MFTKACAFVLLILALSPFTEPFQAHNADAQQIIALEPLLAEFRRNADLRSLSTPELERVAASATVFTTPSASTDPARLLTSRSRSYATTADDFALATPLRL